MQLLQEFDAKKTTKPTTPKLDMCKCGNCHKTMKVSECEEDYGHHNGWEMPAYTEILCPHCDDGGCVDDFWPSDESIDEFCKDKSMLKPSNDDLITMARLVYEKSELHFLNASFSIDVETNDIVVRVHDDEKNTSKILETVTISELVASYIGLGLKLDLDANDAVTTGHRLGRTFR